MLNYHLKVECTNFYDLAAFLEGFKLTMPRRVVNFGTNDLRNVRVCFVPQSQPSLRACRALIFEKALYRLPFQPSLA